VDGLVELIGPVEVLAGAGVVTAGAGVVGVLGAVVGVGGALVVGVEATRFTGVGVTRDRVTAGVTALRRALGDAEWWGCAATLEDLRLTAARAWWVVLLRGARAEVSATFGTAALGVGTKSGGVLTAALSAADPP
jgi:hypothetical protein